MSTLCWVTCMIFGLVVGVLGEVAGSCSFFAAGFVIVALDKKRSR